MLYNIEGNYQNGYYHSKKMNIRKPEKLLFSEPFRQRIIWSGKQRLDGHWKTYGKLRGRDS